uniref:uncharacterized protein LOC132660624 n=1 Tax=Panthera onca TaxID=9690 RepID=UPI0029548C47|nr:uncharacterized protein LOC132660624 [Panthera onca]
MEPSTNKPTQPFYPSSPLAKLSPLGRGAGPCRAADWIPSPASASPAALTPSRRDSRLGDTRAGLCPLAPHARRGRKSCPAPPAPAAGGPRGATLGAEGRRATSTSPPGPVATASPPGSYPGAVVAHHHLPALAVHRAPGREPPPPNDLQPLLPGPFLFLLLFHSPSFSPTFFPQPEVTARPHPPFKTQPARKRWRWEGGGRDWQQYAPIRDGAYN